MQVRQMIPGYLHKGDSIAELRESETLGAICGALVHQKLFLSPQSHLSSTSSKRNHPPIYFLSNYFLSGPELPGTKSKPNVEDKAEGSQTEVMHVNNFVVLRCYFKLHVVVVTRPLMQSCHKLVWCKPETEGVRSSFELQNWRVLLIY
jgi:hypothetical protein